MNILTRDNMARSRTKIKMWLKPWVGPKIVSLFFHPYQNSRFSSDKFTLISSKIDVNKISNVLDIGCNYGQITERFSRSGKFSVGIDAIPCFPNDLYNNGGRGPVFGVFAANLESVELLPEFDVVLLLSVHHQWVKEYGDEYAKKLIGKIVRKSKKYFVIEFAALSSKYGYESPMFLDNNEESVREYAEAWLRGVEFSGELKYIGKNKEDLKQEPYRYTYMIKKY